WFLADGFFFTLDVAGKSRRHGGCRGADVNGLQRAFGSPESGNWSFGFGCCFFAVAGFLCAKRAGAGRESVLREIPGQDPAAAPVGTASGKGFSKNKTLDSILNIELIKDKDADEIREIWKQYFSLRNSVYAVIPGESFELIWRRAKTCPSFLYALPRKEGYEFFVGQWSGSELHFTALINIQTAGDAAPSQLILYHYPEFQKDKGIVLMTSEIDTKFLNVQDAQCLANQVQLFYGSDGAETFGLVEKFNHKSDEFKYMAVVSFLEQSGLGKSFLNEQGHNKEDKLE
uniref:ATP synthase mitochondrial F1 complex assembly factor 1 n=1 Tax=Xenopus tropicalis TaxID=8364 RepID=A0A803JB26_XENTR